MAIKVGDRLPEGTLTELIDTERPGCTIGPNNFAVSEQAKGVDEIWCVAANDAFVMGAWGKDQKAGGKVRMMADGSATYAKALGLDMDLIARGMGVRSQRYSMLVEDGVVKRLNVEAPGKFEVSSGEAMLAQL